MNSSPLFALAVAGVFAVPACAQELKVDLNQTNGRKDVLSTRWENWNFTDGTSDTATFGGIKATLRDPAGAALKGSLYKGALDTDARMVADGVRPDKPGGSIELVLSGLSAGKHTLVSYHSDPDKVAAGTPVNIAVNGTVQAKAVTPSVRAVNDYDAGTGFVEFEAEAGKDVVLRFSPSPGAENGRIILNGFVLDAPDPAKRARKPVPAMDDEHVPVDATLTWTAPAGARHFLYFGSNEDKVRAAGQRSPEFKGKLEEAKYSPPPLDHMQTYFWRVDEVQDGKISRGEVWRFRPRFLAFPTAEGYGRFARGGRGGRVIEVTNLLDYDSGEAPIPGSYRAAIEAEGPRTVVFRVSGVIKLKRACTISDPYITVAGQTAPGDGICVANYPSGAYSTHDAIIRFMRFRVGDVPKKGVDGAGLGNCDHAIMDHCSISWASDEGTSSRGARNITFQRNIVAESLQHSYHYNARDRTKFETHAFAGSISGQIGSYHHNLLAHCTDRNWSLAGGYNQAGQYAGHLDIRNNVVYNWTARTTDGGVMELNYVNNYYKPGPQPKFVNWLLKLDAGNTVEGTPQRYYMSGNVMEGFDYEKDNWQAFQNGPEAAARVRSDKPLYESYVKTQTAKEAFPDVLANVGATFPKQDAIDKRIIEEVRTGTTHYTGTKGPTYDPPSKNVPGIIDEPTDVKDAAGSPDFPWPEYKTYNVPTDTDHDGMPDDWETARGLNPKDANDGNGDRNGDGYTNLEEYLGWLVGEFK